MVNVNFFFFLNLLSPHPCWSCVILGSGGRKVRSTSFSASVVSKCYCAYNDKESERWDKELSWVYKYNTIRKNRHPFPYSPSFHPLVWQFLHGPKDHHSASSHTETSEWKLCKVASISNTDTSVSVWNWNPNVVTCLCLKYQTLVLQKHYWKSKQKWHLSLNYGWIIFTIVKLQELGALYNNKKCQFIKSNSKTIVSLWSNTVMWQTMVTVAL